MTERSESKVQRISKTTVEALSPGARIIDDKVDGFLARRLPSGAITYGFRYRIKGKSQRWISLGMHGRSHYTADRARKDADKLALRIRNGEDPYEDDKAKRDAEIKQRQRDKNTVNAVLDDFLKEYVRSEKKLRSEKAIERMFKNHVRPAIGTVSIYDIQNRRSEINTMLKGIAKKAGPVARDRVLSNLRKAFHWYETEDDNFRTPIVKGMSKNSAKERTRVLDNDDIRSLWLALRSDEVNPAFASLVRVLLYTGQRRNDVAGMHDREIKSDSEWIIPAGRYKNQGDHYVYLTERTRTLLPKTKGFIFGSETNGRKPFSGFSKPKAKIDEVIAEQRKTAKLPAMEHFTLHDLRRTARTRMSELQIPENIAELAIGHAKKGLQRVYDQHKYRPQITDALQRLSNLLDSIIDPPPANVVPFTKAEAT
jgi:integrase